MQLTLFRRTNISHMALPDKVSGHYWLCRNLIGVEGVLGQWIMKPGRDAWLQGEDGEKLKETVLKSFQFYTFFIKDLNETAFVYSEPITEDRSTYEKLLLPAGGTILIGRGCDCDIVYGNPFVSNEHGEILIEDGKLFINDKNSANGIFVNGLRIQNEELQVGDVVYILGLKIVVGKNLIAMNNPDHSVSYNTAFLKKYVVQAIEQQEDEEKYVPEQDCFYRSPRFKRDVETAKIIMDPPPPPVNLETLPLMLLIGPSMTMGMASISMGAFTVINVVSNHGSMMSAMPTIIMSGSMLLGTVMWPLLTKRYEKNRNRKREKLRQEKYQEYLDVKRIGIDTECLHQREILLENHITLENCISRISERSRTLWERMKAHNDFLNVRLGVGDLPLDADIQYPQKRFSMDDDNLQDALYRLADSPKILKDVPVTYSLEKQQVSGLIGERKKVLDLVRGMIIQIAALHSYDEVKMVFIYSEKEREEWKFAKWLPHTWDDGLTIRFLASNQNDIKELSAYFEKLLYNRKAMTEKQRSEITSHYLIFAADQTLASRMEAVRILLDEKEEMGVSLITLYDQLKNLPKECAMVIELEESVGKLYDKDDISGKRQTFIPDTYLGQSAEVMAKELANIRLDLSSQRFALPNMLTFLELFQVGKAEHLNALVRWKENNPVITLRTPVGVNRQGELFYLDLHEKFHGPHGLIAGMTGSGKSEFIITFILSLAINYHPDELAFILIDYKGGGLAGAFENDKVRLPHLAGTITNLDGAAVNRSLISIQSELRRRQAVFNTARKISDEGTMDIYKYQKLYREGVVSEAVPHLFIISDEFAELKTQQPEFMAQLISAARIGRSLGVHLILATQKPTGVVDDQIWSNSRFRICLKVQEKADSMDMIKRPDAAEISATGRFYLQVGFNELFEMGQSAWCGADYEPQDRVEKKIDNSIVVVDELGRVVKEAKPARQAGILHNCQPQVVAIMEYLSQIAQEEDIRTRPLWLPVIPAIISVGELKKKYGYAAEEPGILEPIIGELDDPFNQNQRLLKLPITKEGNAVVYGTAGSGKA